MATTYIIAASNLTNTSKCANHKMSKAMSKEIRKKSLINKSTYVIIPKTKKKSPEKVN